MREIKNKFPSRPAGLGGCGASCGTQSHAEARHEQKCRSQRVPLRLNIGLPTVDGAGAVTSPEIDLLIPDHDGDCFDPDTIFITAEYINEDGNLTDANEVYVRFVKIGKKSFDCLSQDEEYGVQVLAYSQPDCCDGIEFCVPPFSNKDKSKDLLTIEIVNHQTELLADGTVVGRPVRIRGFLKGACINSGYQAACPAPPEVPATAAA